MSEETSEKSKRLETYCGLLLAVFAGILAITDLFGGKYGDDQMIAVNEKTSAFLWYQSKGIKHDLTEGRYELLKSLIATGAIAEDKRNSIDSLANKLEKKMSKYKKEQKEILLGSAAVGRDNWVQEDKEGKLGNVTGAQEYTEIQEKLDEAGNYFDYATLFLQISLVMGAISIISSTSQSQRNFFIAMIVLGITGALIASHALILAS